MRIGIMGGTFDPPHLGHVLPVASAATQFSLDRVDFIPNHVPPHKGRQPVANAYHRAAMLALALQDYPSFLFSAIELLRGDISYTVDTISAYKQNMNSGDALFFLMGSDSFLEIESWYQYQRLLTMTDLIIIDRGTQERELKEHLHKLEQLLQLNLSRAIYFNSSPHLPISSTEIRSRIQAGGTVSTMVTPEVEAYIRKHSIYSGR